MGPPGGNEGLTGRRRSGFRRGRGWIDPCDALTDSDARRLTALPPARSQDSLRPLGMAAREQVNHPTGPSGIRCLLRQAAPVTLADADGVHGGPLNADDRRANRYAEGPQR